MPDYIRGRYRETMNVLLTSAGRRGYLASYFKEALQKAGCGGLVHCANSQPSPAMAYGDRSVITPLIYDEAYIPFLLDYCKREEIGLLIPLFDIDIPVLAARRADFQAVGTLVVTADPQAAEICNDKWKTWEFLCANGIGAPRTWLKEEEALEAAESGLVSFPMMVKPRWGMGSLSVFRAENREELRILGRKSRREIMDSYLRYESGQAVDSCVLFQEMIRGQEYGLDVINDLEGRWQATIVKEKTAMRSGETDEARTVQLPELQDLGRRLGELLGHRGNLDVDVFHSGDRFYVLEMNARFGGGYPFSHAAGADLPLALVLWALGRPVPGELLEARPGVRALKDIRMLIWNQ